jgi:Cation transporter/ATPase, N-terminus
LCAALLTNLIFLHYNLTCFNRIKCRYLKQRDIPDDKTFDLRREIDMDDHDVQLATLLQRYKTDVNQGLTLQSVEENRLNYGRNRLTPPPAISEWVIERLFYKVIAFLPSFECSLQLGIFLRKMSKK